jgi:hypothetical protein
VHGRRIALLVLLGSAYAGCASPLELVATANPTRIDLSTSHGQYPIHFALTLTNHDSRSVRFESNLAYAIRVEAVRRDGRRVPPHHAGTAYCCSGTDMDVPCPCEPPRSMLLAPGQSVRYAQSNLDFDYCDRRGQGGVEYRLQPGRYAIRFVYAAHGVKARSNEVTFEIRGR